MQDQVTMFRALLIISIVLSIIGAFIDFIIPGLLPESLSSAYEAYAATEASMPAIIIAGLASIVLMVVAVIATVGLLVLQRWARSLALWSTVVSFLMYPLLGAMLQSGLAVMLAYIAMALWGAALAMAYYSDVKSHFQRPAK